MCEVLNNVVNVISGLDGVLEVRQLSNDDILKIIDMEAQRSKDIVPYSMKEFRNVSKGMYVL